MDLQSIDTLSMKFGMSVNPTKCQAIIVGSKRMISRWNTALISPIAFNGSAIPFSSVVEDLHLHIASILDWRAQVAYTSPRCSHYRFLEHS